MRHLIGLVAVLANAPWAAVAAQQADTAQRLPDLRVSVTRAGLSPASAGLAVTLLDSADLRRGRALPTLEEALGFAPGVLARDRGDQSLDQRLTIRGAGARANFGVRGVRVLLDGVPATLPDGQTPLTALDLQLARRIEVARGPLATLHGNGSQGVVSIETAARLAGPWHAEAGVEAGRDATTNWHAVLGGGGDRLGGLVAASRLTSDGWRTHSRSDQRRVRGAVEWQPTDRSTLTVRGTVADDPVLDSPGALTLEEFAADPRQANPNSVRRDAGKDLQQRSLSLGWRQATDAVAMDVTGWITARDLVNPIAAPAPAPADPEEGIWIGIDRRVVGVRSAVRTALGSTTLLVAGVDVQRMIDDRVNRRHRAGEVFGGVLLDQQERISEIGPFAQVSGGLGGDLVARAGVRHDRVAFNVTDKIDSASSGSRTMAAWSASGALAWAPSPFEAWLGVGSAFETPTTTELANRPDGATGLNDDLDPARTVSVEVGVRWRRGTASLELVSWRAVTRDAITPVAEVGGRSFFANVGRTRSHGAELAAVVPLTAAVRVRASATWLANRFGDDARAADGSAIAGRRLPGVWPFTGRVGITASRGTLGVDVDHGWSSGVWADDANTRRVEGWGVGITNLHVRWATTAGIALSAGVRNVFDRDHVAGVVANGGFGRVVEPGRPRSVTVGATVALGGR